jgi:hypothetical protein
MIFHYKTGLSIELSKITTLAGFDVNWGVKFLKNYF